MSGERILVVEDESVVAMHLQRALQRLGYQTLYASGAEQALKLATETRPDLVMMDIMLGGPMDGIHVAERLRAGDIAPVIYLTAYTDRATLARARQTQPMGYLVKPFREPELESTIEMALFRSAAEKRLFEKEQLAEVLLESLSDGVVRADRRGRITLLNRAATECFGKPAEQCLACELISLFENCSTEARAEIAEALAGALKHEVRSELRGLKLRRDGAQLYQASLGPAYDRGRRLNGVMLIVSANLAAQHDSAEKTVPGRRVTDPLTGLPGRPELENLIDRAFDEGVPLYAGIIVLERFHCIVERFGGAAADELLVFFSVHLAQSLASTDRLYRWTGPAFVVITADESVSLMDVRREIANLASVRLEPFVRVGSHTALVPLSARNALVPITDCPSPEAAIRSIDAAVADPEPRPVR